MKKTLSAGLVGFLAVSGLASAQVEPQQSLEEIVITARSIEETLAVELADYGHDVEMIDADRINQAGYVDVSTALQFEVPGLFVSPEAGPFTYVDVSLQGSRTGDVLWLIDGVRINNRIFNTTTPDALPAGMVERVEVLKGGESLFYGTQGVAGAINIVTRSLADEGGGQLVLGADSNNGYQLSGYADGALNDHKFVFYGSKNDGDGYDQFDIYQPSATDRDRSYDVKNVGLKYGYDFSERARLDVLYHHTDATLDFNRPNVTKRGYNDRDEDVASVKLALDVSDDVELLIKGYLHDWDSQIVDVRNVPITGAENAVAPPPGDYWGYRDYGASALVKVTPSGPAEYHVGYDYQNYKAVDINFPIAGETETVNALFAHIRSAEGTFDNASIAAGVRYNRGSSESATVWNVSGRYNIRGDALYIEGMVSTAFLLPSAEQLYYIGQVGDDCCVGNPNLEPEESENINVSLGGRVMAGDGAFGWQFTAFTRDIDNLINSDDSNAPYEYLGRFYDERYENLSGTVEVRGAEAAVSVATGGGFRIDASHTYTESRMQGDPLKLQIARIPVRYTKFGFGYAPEGSRFDVSATANRVGDTFQSVGAFGRRNIGNYTVLNLAARLKLDADDRHKLGVGVQNVGDEEYATRLASSPRDDGGGNVLVQRLGVPRTFNISYTVDF